MPLAIPLSRGCESLFRQVYSGLREAVLSGTLEAGEKLPSTRELAEQLGVSRSVVLVAYDQLIAEGFAVARGGSGTYVSSVGGRGWSPREHSAAVRLSRFGTAATAAWSRVNVPEPQARALPYDFAYGRSDLATFPFEKWWTSLLRSARRASVADLDYSVAAGSLALREGICACLRRSRAVNCDPSQVIIVNGSQQALDLLARVLINPGDRVIIEEPGYQGTREVLRAAGARLLPVKVDDGGLDPTSLPARARLAVVTPSHQFPTGAILSLRRRLALLEWATRSKAIIIEDDYDGEFRYDGHLLESLQGLDRDGRVVYVGTFSRTVFPSLRLGYMIAPRALVQALIAAKWLSDRHTRTLEQRTLAEFLRNGMYERYLRKVRRRNADRRDALLQAIDRYLGGRVRVTGEGAGAHVVLWPRRRVSEANAIARAAACGVGIYGVAAYFLSRPSPVGFVLGYSRLNPDEISEGIRRLGDVF